MSAVGMKSGKLISNGVAGGGGRHPGWCREEVLPLYSPFLAPSLSHTEVEECHHLYSAPRPSVLPPPPSKPPSPVPPPQILTPSSPMDGDCLHFPQQESRLAKSQAGLQHPYKGRCDAAGTGFHHTARHSSTLMFSEHQYS